MVFPSFTFSYDDVSNSLSSRTQLGLDHMARPNTVTIQYMVLFSHRIVQLPTKNVKRELIMNMVKFNFCCRYHLLSCPRSKSWLCAGRLHSSALSHTSLNEEERERWLHKPIFKGNVSFHGIPMYLNGFCSFVSWLRHCSTTLDVHWFTLLFW